MCLKMNVKIFLKYLECIRKIISEELKLWGVQIKQAIWLQTQEGMD